MLYVYQVVGVGRLKKMTSRISTASRSALIYLTINPCLKGINSLPNPLGPNTLTQWTPIPEVLSVWPHKQEETKQLLN